MNNQGSEQATVSRSVLLLMAVVFLFLCAGTTGVGFLLGREQGEETAVANIQPETIVETVVETVEVTRVVTVVEESEPEVEEEVAAEVEEPPATATPVPLTPIPPTLVPTAVPEATSGPPVDIETFDLDKFFEVWQLVSRQFDGELPTEEALIQAIIDSSLDTLDDNFTRYIPPEIAIRSRENMGGSIEGIGALVEETEEGLPRIVRPLDGQPADKAGLLPGDVIVAVDGVQTSELNFNDVILRVRGERGTAVTLTIQREGEEELLEFTIIRARIVFEIVISEMLPENIAYVRLTEFSSNAETQMLEALEELLTQNPQGLILDLRDNPGGFLNQSVAIADLFLDDGIVLFQRDSLGQEQIFRSDDGDLAETVPLVVLVNAGSASASEIVAGAVQDRGRGVLIGDVTFGKGSVQSVNTLSDGAELRVTIARWYTPDNVSISDEGIEPDILVETPLDLGGEDDVQLQRAIEYILTGE